MRISDWSSDVCSSDLLALPRLEQRLEQETEDRFGKIETDAEGDDQRGDAIEQPPTQLDQVIEQRRARIFQLVTVGQRLVVQRLVAHGFGARGVVAHWADRQSTRLNSSH